MERRPLPTWDMAGNFGRVTLLGRVGQALAGGSPTARAAPPSAVGSAERVERTMLALFLAMRGGILLLEGPLYRGSGRRLTAANAAAWAAVAASTAVTGSRGFPRPGRRGLTTVAIDTAATATALAIRSFDAPGEFDWAAGAAFWSAASVGGPIESRWGQLLAVTPLASVYGAVRLRRNGAPVRGMRVVQDLVLLYVFAVGIGEVIRRMRLAAAEIESEVERAVNAAEVATRIEEEIRARSELHVGAVRALESIRRSWPRDEKGARRIAAAEARRIRGWLDREASGRGVGTMAELHAGLSAIVDEVGACGIDVELIAVELEQDVRPEAATALVAAVRYALVTASRPGDRILIRVVSQGDGVVLTARSRGSRDLPWAAVMEEVTASVEPCGGHAQVVGDRLEVGFPA